MNRQLTRTGLHAFQPTVTDILVADTSTILIPRATMSATTHSAGFLENATVGTCYHRRRDASRVERRNHRLVRYTPSC